MEQQAENGRTLQDITDFSERMEIGMLYAAYRRTDGKQGMSPAELVKKYGLKDDHANTVWNIWKWACGIPSDRWQKPE